MEATLAAHLEKMQQTDRHPVVSFLSALFWVVCECQRRARVSTTILTRQTVYLLSWIKALAALITISVPRLIYFLLSYSLTLTVRPIRTLTVEFGSLFTTFS